MEVQTRALDALTPHPDNYRAHPDDQVEHLMASLERHGFYRPVVVSSDGFILAGHGIVEAARKLELDEAPVLEVPYPHDSAQAKSLLVADNETGNLAEDDDHLLVALLQGLAEDDLLLGSGYDEFQVNALEALIAPPRSLADFDPDEAWADAGLEPHQDGTPRDFRLTLRFASSEARQGFLDETPHVDKREVTPNAWVATVVER